MREHQQGVLETIVYSSTRTYAYSCECTRLCANIIECNFKRFCKQRVQLRGWAIKLLGALGCICDAMLRSKQEAAFVAAIEHAPPAEQLPSFFIVNFCCSCISVFSWLLQRLHGRKVARAFKIAHKFRPTFQQRQPQSLHLQCTHVTPRLHGINDGFSSVINSKRAAAFLHQKLNSSMS